MIAGMRSVLLGTLRTQSRRYVSAALAIIIAVAFVVITGALTSSARSGLTAGIDAPYLHADAVIDRPDVELAESIVAQAPDRTSTVAFAAQPVSLDGRQLSDQALIGSVPDAPELRWHVLEDGRFPSGAGEAVVEASEAKARELALGDQLRIGAGAEAVSVTVVGLVESESVIDTASVYLTWTDLARFGEDLQVQSVQLVGDGFDLPGDVTVLDPQEHADNVLAEVNNEVDMVSMMVLLFAAVALFVSVLVIANTFSILFAQRRRDFALLRCVGATRRQVVRSVRAEAVALGMGASLIGLVVGVLSGYGLVALIRAVADNAPLGEVALGPVWLVGGFALGLLVTVAASWLPTRHVVRVSPLVALRPEGAPSARTAAGRLRIGLGLLLVLAGAGLLGLAINVHSNLVMVAGGALTFVGVLALGPLVVPALIRVLGGGAARVLGTSTRLAAANSVRNPRRTATTTAALLVGVTLTTAVLTGMTSTRGALDQMMAEQHPVDVALTSTEPLPDDVVRRVSTVPDVAHAVAVAGAAGTIGQTPVTVLAPDHADRVLHDPALAPEPGEIRLPLELLPEAEDGDRLTLTVGGESAELRVVRGEGWGDAVLVAPQTLAGLTDDTAAYAVWIRAAEGADPDDLAGDLTVATREAEPQIANGLGKRAWVDLQMDVLTWSVVGLLGIAVLIALVGIANTLGLSVLERTREHALLRALGLTRRSLRRVLATEGVLLATAATLLGTGLGVTFAWVGMQVMVAPAVDDAALVLPWGQLAVAVAVTALSGLLAATLPSRRGARVAPAAGLAAD